MTPSHVYTRTWHRANTNLLIGLVLLLQFQLLVSKAFAGETRYRITSVTQNLNHQQWQIGGTLSNGLKWSVVKTTLHGGKQEGVELITVDNGTLRLSVIPTRGMSIHQVVMGELRLGWSSPVKELVHPQHVNLDSRGGLGWLEGFNEWMVRCGLEFAGHPGTDRFVNNVGDEAQMDLTLHGKIGNTPASEVEVIVTDASPPTIRVRGRVDERMFYGPQLELWTEVSTVAGSTQFRIDDQITNHAAQEQEFEIIYHANYGPPILEEGARFVGPVQHIMPMNAHAAKSIDTYSDYAGPTAGFIEQVYCIRPYGDEHNNTEIMLRNKLATHGVSMRYSLDQLPYLTLWKNTLSEENGYVTGLEPGTNFPFNRRVERQFGRLSKLAANAKRSFGIEFQLHATAESVQHAAERIVAIQNGRNFEVDHDPPKID